jgi:mannose/fructose/N-acetylgalactosamine-specific phosphotransferase system component IIC
MSTQKKPSVRRGEIAFIFAIVLGLLLGLLIKRVRLGLLLGAGLGLAIVFLGAMGSSRK